MALPSSTGDLRGTTAAQAVNDSVDLKTASAASSSQAMDFLGAQKKQTISSQSISKASKIKVLVHSKTRFAQQTKREKEKIQIEKASKMNTTEDHKTENAKTQQEKDEATQPIAPAEPHIDSHEHLLAESASNQQKEGAEHSNQKDSTDQQDEQQREEAAVKIQKVHRGNADRQQVSEVRVLQEKKNEAATKIQSLERGRQCRQQLAAEQEEQQRRTEAILRIQGAQRGMEFRNQEAAALKIQKVQRGNVSRKVGLQRKEAATRIQSLERGRQCRQQLTLEKEKKQQEDAAVKIQKVQRGNACRQIVSVERKQKEDAAKKIQSLERGRQCRQQLAQDKIRQKEKIAAVKIQKMQRGNASRKHDQQKKEAAIRIQSLERGRKCRHELAAVQKKKKDEEAAAVKIQKVQRGKVARREAEVEREKRRKEEKAKRLCFPKRGGISALCSSKNEVPQKPTGKSSRLRTYQLCHAEAKRQTQKDGPLQAQPKGPTRPVEHFKASKSASRSVTPAGSRIRTPFTGSVQRSATPGNSLNVKVFPIQRFPPQPIAASPGVPKPPPSSATPGRNGTPAGRIAAPSGRSATPAGRSATPAGRSATAVGGSVLPAGRSATPGRKNFAAAKARSSDAGSTASVQDFASSVQKMLGCQRVAARLAQKRLELQQSKKELAEQHTSAAIAIQACVRSRLELRRLETWHQRSTNATKIQAWFRGWKGRQLFRSRLKAQRALRDFDQQIIKTKEVQEEVKQQVKQQVKHGANDVQPGLIQDKKGGYPVSKPGTSYGTCYQQLHRTAKTSPNRGIPFAKSPQSKRAASKGAPSRRWM